MARRGRVRREIILGMLASLLCGACGRDPLFCTAIYSPGLIVTVRDSTTAVALCDARVSATEETSRSSELLLAGMDCKYRGSGQGEAGTYDLRVEKDGYAPRIVRGIQVGPAGECGTVPDSPVNMNLDPML